MTSLYEAMFLLDNQVVRQDWSKAKAVVTDLLAKHGATVKSARRWDERRLAYPIKKRNRATFLLTYTEIPAASVAPLRRDLELSENILRYLFLSKDEVPAEELELASAEGSEDFVVPLPPEDHELDVVEEEKSEEESTGEKAEGEATEEAATEEPKAEEAAAETEDTTKKEEA